MDLLRRLPRDQNVNITKDVCKKSPPEILGTSTTSTSSNSHRFYNVFLEIELWQPSDRFWRPEIRLATDFCDVAQTLYKYWFGHTFDFLRRLPRDQNANITKDVCKEPNINVFRSAHMRSNAELDINVFRSAHMRSNAELDINVFRSAHMRSNAETQNE